MANAVFTTKAEPVYDDLPERQYHFPRTYLNQASQAVGDFIVYYEPRRESADLSGRSGRQAYFATARIARIVEDPKREGFFFAYVTDYLEFPKPVPFHIGEHYFESALKKGDGSTNKGAFGRSVRVLPASEYQAICSLGFAGTDLSGAAPFPDSSPIDATPRVEEDVPVYGRPSRTILLERPFRDAAFTRVIHSAYGATCAMTGLHLVNGGGRCEIEAAHIVPVEDNGPDSPRNGIALSRTVHWMFDRGIVSIADSGEILIADRWMPDQIRGLLNPSGKILPPSDPSMRPHPAFLLEHRKKFKGN